MSSGACILGALWEEGPCRFQDAGPLLGHYRSSQMASHFLGKLGSWPSDSHLHGARSWLTL